MSLWTLAGGGEWTNAANWSAGVPNAAGADADFVLTGSGALREISFDGLAPVRLGNLNVAISGSQGLWFHGSLADGGAGSGLLIFDCLATDPYALVSINTAVGGGEFEISNFGELTVQLDDVTRFDVVNAGTIARINTSITGGPNAQLQKAGAGTLLLGAFNNASFTGGVLVDGGTLDALDASALGTGNIFIRNNAMLVSDGTLASGISTFNAQTGTVGSARIAAHSGTTLTLAGTLNHISNGTLSFGAAINNGTVVLDLDFSTQSSANGIRIDGGTVRIGNSYAAGNFLGRTSSGLTEISAGATLDTGGFVTAITNLDLDGGTIRTSTGSLLFTSNDSSPTQLIQTGTIEGTGGGDSITFNVLNHISLAAVTFTNWATGGFTDFITINGSANANNLTGSTMKDTFNGLGGNDTLIGNGGADVISAGDGDDLIVLNAQNGGSSINGGIGIDTLRVTGGTIDLFSMTGIEAIELQSNAALVLSSSEFFSLPGTAAISGTGSISTVLSSAQNVLTNNFALASGSNITFNITGSSGNDTITIHPDAIGIVSDSGGADTITGGNKGDTVSITGGIDTVNAGAGNDLVVVSSGSNGSHVHGGSDTDTLRIGSGAVNLGTVTGFEAINMTAGTNLTLTTAQLMAGFAPNTGVSGSGTITINLAPEVFTAIPGFQNVGGGVNFVYTGSTGGDYVKAGHFLNTINGGVGQDFLRGGNLVDTIDGGADVDKITGWGGADVLTGGGGGDFFRYLYATDSGVGAAADRITDFTIGSDVIDLRLLDSDIVTPDIQSYALNFIGSAAFGNTGAGQIRYGTSGADMLVQFDLDGNGSSDMEIILQGLAGQTLSASDFIIPTTGAEPLPSVKGAAPPVMDIGLSAPKLPAADLAGSEPLLTVSFDDPFAYHDHGLDRWHTPQWDLLSLA